MMLSKHLVRKDLIVSEIKLIVLSVLKMIKVLFALIENALGFQQKSWRYKFLVNEYKPVP